MEESQNLVRGAIARFKTVSSQRIFSEKKRRKPVVEINPATELRRNLQIAVAQSRRKLSPHEYGAFFDYYEEATSAAALGTASPAYDYLQGYFDAPVLSLRDELRWTVERLNHEASTVRSHLETLLDIDASCLRGRYDTAKGSLEKSCETTGHSLWSVQLSIALESQIGGLEAQKQLYEKIRRRNRKGMLAHISYYTSIRNEGRSTLLRFREDTRVRLSKTTPRPVSLYLAYKLLGDWPANDKDVCSVLRVEQCHSIVDLYETVVALAQECVRNPELAWLQPTITPHLAKIKISDFRLQKALLHLQDAPATGGLVDRDISAGDALFEGRASKAIWIARHHLDDVWTLIYQAAAAGQSVRMRKVRHASVRRSLALLLSGRSEGLITNADLEKLCFNLAGLPSHRAIYDFVSELSLPKQDSQPYRFHLTSLNAKYLGPEDFYGRETKIGIKGSATIAIWARQESSSTLLDQSLRTFSVALAHEALGDLEQARLELEKSRATKGSNILGTLSAALLLRTLTSLGDRRAVISLLADLVSQSHLDPGYARISDALAIVEFRHIKAYGHGLEPLIALHVQQLQNEDEKLKSQLRFATKAFLKASDFQRPSKIAVDDAQYQLDHLVYFLREICVPSILDVTGIFKSSSEVLEERQEICGLLNSLDPQRTDDYQSEMIGLEHNRKISQGLRIVNKNRIHVDTELVSRSFAKANSEEFNRYVDLQLAGIGVSDDYDEVFRALISANKNSRLPIFDPENEADATLALLVSRVREEFLNHSGGGLDFFLSKRIRHQSFVGLVRGPVEFERLITTKETAASEYRDNDFWVSQFSELPEGQKALIEQAFRKFSVQFDQAILDVKDRLFHVRSPEQPEGIFEIPIAASTVALVRAIMQEIRTAEEFAKTMCVILWALAEGSLQNARAIIQDRLKMRVASLFDELRMEVTTFAGDSKSLASLSLAIGRASAEVQQALSDAQAWFNRPETEQAVQLFTLEEALDIAIESAKKLNRAFDPVLSRKIFGALQLQASDMVFITDAVFIAFSNARAYSGLKQPKVTVDCFIDHDSGTLRLEVSNEVANRVRTPEQEARLEAIRKQIAEGTAGRLVRREGGTGFLKLGNVVKQSKKGDITFGYVDDNHFKLAVTWSLILHGNEGGQVEAAHPSG